jgi:hypothetical protein
MTHLYPCDLTPQDQVVARLKEVMEDFKEILPLIEELANPALKPRHWQDIFGFINAEMPESETGTGAHLRAAADTACEHPTYVLSYHSISLRDCLRLLAVRGSQPQQQHATFAGGSRFLPPCVVSPPSVLP